MKNPRPAGRGGDGRSAAPRPEGRHAAAPAGPLRREAAGAAAGAAGGRQEHPGQVRWAAVWGQQRGRWGEGSGGGTSSALRVSQRFAPAAAAAWKGLGVALCLVLFWVLTPKRHRRTRKSPQGVFVVRQTPQAQGGGGCFLSKKRQTGANMVKKKTNKNQTKQNPQHFLFPMGRIGPAWLLFSRSPGQSGARV